MQPLPAIPNIFKLRKGPGSPRQFQDNLIIFSVPITGTYSFPSFCYLSHIPILLLQPF